MSYQRKILITGEEQCNNNKVKRGILCIELYPIPPSLI